MEVVYRLQGLDGEATEPLVETLHDTAAVDVNPEEEAAMTALMSETNGN
jgi:E3 ubiquitin-protein ligase UBR4